VTHLHYDYFRLHYDHLHHPTTARWSAERVMSMMAHFWFLGVGMKMTVHGNSLDWTVHVSSLLERPAAETLF